MRKSFDEVMIDLAGLVEDGHIERVWNIGGAEIYKWGLERGIISTIEITKIHQEWVVRWVITSFLPSTGRITIVESQLMRWKQEKAPTCSFDADVKVPDIPWEDFRKVASSEEQVEKGVKFTFETYHKV